MFGITWLQRQMLFPRSMVRPTGPPDDERLEQLWIESDAGPVEAWILPGDGCSRERPGPAVVHAHGNGELIDRWPDALKRYRELGVTLVLPEYRGYGRSAGEPSEEAITEDLRALHRRLRDHPAIDASRLVYHGRSLGGGALCTLLREHPPHALILESTFTSVADVARGMGVPSFLIADKFENLDALERYDGPLLVIHGTRDQVIPVRHGRRIASAYPRAELVLYDSGHNDLPPPGSDYWARIQRFLRDSDVIGP